MSQVNYVMPEGDTEFQRCITFVLEQECRRRKDGTLDDGYVNDPHDPGGETKYGISKRAYPKLDIKNLTLEDALALYYRDYWYLAKSSGFPLDVCVLDCAVNEGTKIATQFLQVSSGDYQVYIQQRMEHYNALLHGKFLNNPNRLVYQKSWYTRLNNLKKFIDVELAKTVD